MNAAGPLPLARCGNPACGTVFRPTPHQALHPAPHQHAVYCSTRCRWAACKRRQREKHGLQRLVRVRAPRPASSGRGVCRCTKGHRCEACRAWRRRYHDRA